MMPPHLVASSTLAAADHRPSVVRKIIHIDMDAFYASVEQRDEPTLRGKPVAVGGSRERGVVAAASYEARRFGVRSAMPSLTALRLCPDLIFVKPRFAVYKAVSQQIRDIFADYTALIEPLSLDEAYLDVTDHPRSVISATALADEIRSRIRTETGLTASAGVSYNKFLAKLASDQRKPDGLFVVTPAQGQAFVAGLPVSRFHGVGPVTAKKMEVLGILTGQDLRDCAPTVLAATFGKAGRVYHDLARAIDDRPVKADRIRRSIGSESTFSQDLTSAVDLAEGLEPAIVSVWDHSARAGMLGRTVTLKVKYSDFRQVTRSRSVALPVGSLDHLREIALALLGGLLPVERSVRLLGLSVSNFVGIEPASSEDAQLRLDL